MLFSVVGLAQSVEQMKTSRKATYLDKSGKTFSHTKTTNLRGGGCSLEEFDAGLPFGWDADTTNLDSTWTFPSTGGNPDGWAEIQWDPTLVPQDESFYTNSYDLTLFSEPTLFFDWNASFYWSVSPNDNYDLFVDITVDGGSTWENLWREPEVEYTPPYTWFSQYLDISAYSTATDAKFRFRYVGVDGAQAGFDNIGVCEAPGNDLVLNSVLKGDPDLDFIYSKVPLSQVQPVIAGAEVFNYGVNTQKNVVANWTLYFDGDSVTSGVTAPIDSIISEGTDTAWIETGYTASAVGALSISVEVLSDANDLTPVNNMDSVLLHEVTEYIWAHDFDMLTYSEVGEGPVSESEGFEIGCRYFTGGVGAELAALDFPLHTNTGDETRSAELKVYEESATEITLVESEIFDFEGTDLSGLTNPVFMTAVFQNPVVLNPNTVYRVAIGFTAGDSVVIQTQFYTDNDLSQLGYSVLNSQWTNWINITYPVRLNFEPSVGVEERVNTLEGFYIYPNPAAENLTVGFRSKIDQDLVVSLVDITGSLVSSRQLSAQSGAANSVSFNVDNVAAGVYLLSVKGNESSLTRRVVIQ